LPLNQFDEVDEGRLDLFADIAADDKIGDRDGNGSRIGTFQFDDSLEIVGAQGKLLDLGGFVYLLQGYFVGIDVFETVAVVS
jgi:hypothetical protein